MAKEKTAIPCKIVKFYGVISENEKTDKILAEVSWNNRPAKLEVRNRDKETGTLMKGIALSFEEIGALYKLISSEHVLDGMDIDDHQKEAFDLDDALSNTSRLQEIRKEFATKDGLILLHRTSVIEFHATGKVEFISVYDFNRKRVQS